MYSNEFMISKFKEVLGEPDDLRALMEYVEFIQNNICDINYDGRSEVHHKLPRHKFPSYEYDVSNLVRLTIENHRKAHFLLAAAYQIPGFIRTLNWMHDSEKAYDEYRKLQSNAIKKWWMGFKLTDEFTEWSAKRSASAKGFMATSDNAVNVNKATREKYGEAEYKNICSRGGKNPERAKRQGESLKKFYEDDINREKKSKEAKELWDKRSNEFRNEFTKTMSEVNKDPTKRAKAGASIKNKWEDPAFRERQLATKAATAAKLKAEGKKRSNSGTMKAKWEDPIWKAETLKKRADNFAKRKLQKEMNNEA